METITAVKKAVKTAVMVTESITGLTSEKKAEDDDILLPHRTIVNTVLLLY